MSLVPRDYQNDAHNALWNAVHTQWDKNPLVVLPTGTGKSLCMAMFIWHMLTTHNRVRIMSVTHVKELIESNYKTMMSLWPNCPAGIYSSGLKKKDVHSQVTFAGIQSVAKRAATFGHIDFLLVDEAHRINDSQSTSYSMFIKELSRKNPNLIVIGYTATDFRMKTGRLTEGDLFDHICYDGSDGSAFLWFIENGYLIKLIPKAAGFQLNSDNVGILGGEFNIRDASDAMRDQNILERAVDTTIQQAREQGRRCNLTFCQTIADADLVAEMFTYKGFPVESVHSNRSDRDVVLSDFKRGKLWGVTNQDILTTGFDNPRIDIITMLRLTRSPGLWVQMLGRGTRPCFEPGYDIGTLEGRMQAIQASHKQSCLVLDFVGNTQRLGPINYPNVPDRRKKGKSTGDMARECPVCKTYNHISVRICSECGYEFPPPEGRIQEDAGSDELVVDLNNLPKRQEAEPEYDVMEVDRMETSFHRAKDPTKPNTMRVTYRNETGRELNEWIGIEHPPGFFRKKAEDWWVDHGGQYCPDNLNDALCLSKDLKKPLYIRYICNRKFGEIVNKDFDLSSTWLADNIEDNRSWSEVIDDEIPF